MMPRNNNAQSASGGLSTMTSSQGGGARVVPTMPSVIHANGHFYTPGHDQWASALQGWVARQDWEAYKAQADRVLPQQAMVVGTDKLVNEQLDRNQVNVKQQFANANQAGAMQRQRMGLGAVPATNSTDQALALAHANNNTRIHAKDRDNAAMAGGSAQAVQARRT